MLIFLIMCLLKVREVLWNNDSSVLAVWCEEMSTEDKEEFHPKSYGM